LGVLFFVTPERAYVLQVLARFWPLFLILAGVLRISGHLLDRQPRSPVGGLVLTSLGGILLAANLRGERSFLYIFGRYWFWLLLALIAGRVIRQYTHRAQDGPRPRAFSLGAIVLMLLIVVGGITANRLAANGHLLARLHERLGHLVDVRDYVFSDQFTIEDEPAQTFALQPNARLVIGNTYGDLEVRGTAQPLASARVIKRVRATEDEARQVAKNIRLQITSHGNIYQLNIAADGVKDFSTTVLLELPQGAPAGLEVEGLAGRVKLSDLRGDHLIRHSDAVEVANNIGRIAVAGSRGPVRLSQVQGEVVVTGARREVSLSEITGAVRLEAQGAAAHIKQITGPVVARVSGGRLEIQGVRATTASGDQVQLVSVEESSNSRITLREIGGNATVTAIRSRVEAEVIGGDLTVASSSERVRASRVAGRLQVNVENSGVEVEGVGGAATIVAARDVSVRDFRGPLEVTTRFGAIRLATSAKLGGDLRASNQQGKIHLALPADSSFRLDAGTTFGRLRLRGFDDLDLPRNQKTALVAYNNNGAAAPLVSLRSTNGSIYLESSGLALARGEDEDDPER
jgi:hypothetical protein